jgi:hypothetical protein
MLDSNVVGINEGGLFDEIAHTQGGMPHLMQYLWDEYCKYLEDMIEERRKEGKKILPLKDAKMKAPATHFAQWATDHLKEFRVVENFYIDANHGIRLSNNVCIAICPGTVIQGTMQDSGAIQVTEGKSQRDMEGVLNTITLRI